MSRWLIASVLGIALGTSVAGTAVAQSAEPGDPILNQDGVRYACTGVGAAGREDPRWKDFSAKVVFAAKGGGYLSEVRTRILDGSGRAVLEVSDCGPWLLVDLPKGRYELTAVAHDDHGTDYESRTTMTVGDKGQSEAVVRFPGIAG